MLDVFQRAQSSGNATGSVFNFFGVVLSELCVLFIDLQRFEVISLEHCAYMLVSHYIYLPLHNLFDFKYGVFVPYFYLLIDF